MASQPGAPTRPLYSEAHLANGAGNARVADGGTLRAAPRANVTNPSAGSKPSRKISNPISSIAALPTVAGAAATDPGRKDTLVPILIHCPHFCTNPSPRDTFPTKCHVAKVVRKRFDPHAAGADLQMPPGFIFSDVVLVGLDGRDRHDVLMLHVPAARADAVLFLLNTFSHLGHKCSARRLDGAAQRPYHTVKLTLPHEQAFSLEQALGQVKKQLASLGFEINAQLIEGRHVLFRGTFRKDPVEKPPTFRVAAGLTTSGCNIFFRVQATWTHTDPAQELPPVAPKTAADAPKRPSANKAGQEDAPVTNSATPSKPRRKAAPTAPKGGKPAGASAAAAPATPAAAPQAQTASFGAITQRPATRAQPAAQAQPATADPSTTAAPSTPADAPTTDAPLTHLAQPAGETQTAAASTASIEAEPAPVAQPAPAERPAGDDAAMAVDASSRTVPTVPTDADAARTFTAGGNKRPFDATLSPPTPENGEMPNANGPQTPTARITRSVTSLTRRTAGKGGEVRPH